ncbi:MAG TPA: TlpA disulfide reductase family protein [Jatrophihabitans sp.]|nr:TlpA disulfide reductase family protein [Jatrophihabitans sp.]
MTSRSSRLPGAAALRAAALAVVGALLLAACSSSSGSRDFSYTSQTKVGSLIPAANRKPAENIGGELLGGGSTHLANYRGRVVIVNFWAAWCSPCRVESPQLDQFYRAMKNKGVTVLGIDIKDDRNSASSFVHDNHISYPIVYDQQGENALRLGNIPDAALPFTVLVDPAGRVAAVYIGPITQKDLQRPVAALRSET